MGDVARFKAKRRPFPIPASACEIIGGRVGSTEYGVRFTLKNRRTGTEVWLHTGRFSWNLSAMIDAWPKGFSAARVFVHGYAAQHGQVVTEAPPRRPRSPRAVGTDAALLRAGGCREAWLRCDIPSLWAEAMVRCQSPAAECGSKGRCAYGDCNMEMDPVEPEEPE